MHIHLAATLSLVLSIASAGLVPSPWDNDLTEPLLPPGSHVFPEPMNFLGDVEFFRLVNDQVAKGFVERGHENGDRHNYYTNLARIQVYQGTRSMSVFIEDNGKQKDRWERHANYDTGSKKWVIEKGPVSKDRSSSVPGTDFTAEDWWNIRNDPELVQHGGPNAVMRAFFERYADKYDAQGFNHHIQLEYRRPSSLIQRLFQTPLIVSVDAQWHSPEDQYYKVWRADYDPKGQRWLTHVNR